MSAFLTPQLYEVLGNPKGRLEREGPYLLELLGRSPVNHVADVACGLGLHARYFAEKGAWVDAFDISGEMVQHARATRNHESIVYDVSDMCEISGGPYGLMVCVGNSLSLLPGVERVSHFLQNCSTRLVPGGRVLIQGLNYESPKMQTPRVRVEQAPLQEGEVVAVKRFLPQQENTLMVITYHWAAQTLSDITETVLLRHWHYRDLALEAEKAGLIVEECLGGYDQSPYDPHTSPDLIITLVKPEAQ